MLPLWRDLNSTLSFSNPIPGKETSIICSFRFDVAVEVGDVIEIVLPGFMASNSLSATSGDFAVVWNSDADVLTLESLRPFSAFEVINERVGALPTSMFTLPIQSIFDGDNSILYSLRRGMDEAPPQRRRFASLSGSGFKRFEIRFDNPSPNRTSAIDITFSTSVAVQPNATISIYLPGFFKDIRPKSELTMRLRLGGRHSFAFNGHWNNESSCVDLTNLLWLTEGETYQLNILSSNNIFTPRGGVGGFKDGSSHPAAQLSASDVLFFDFSVVSIYTRIFGIEDSVFEVALHDNSSDIAMMDIRVVFSSFLKGPFVLEANVPHIESPHGDISLHCNTSGGVEAVQWSADRSSISILVNASLFHESVSVYWVWAHHPSAAEGGILRVRPSSGIPRNDHGITLSLVNAGYGFPDHFRGNLTAYPFRNVSFVPAILHSQVRLVRRYVPPVPRSRNSPFVPDFFANDIEVSFRLNSPMQSGDSVEIDIPGLVLVGSGSGEPSYVMELPSGERISIALEDALIRISLTDTLPDDSANLTEVSFTIPGDRFGKVIMTSVLQHNSQACKISWKTPYFTVGFTPISSPLSVGAVHSSLSFSNRFAGESTSVDLKIITALNLTESDVILWSLPGFVFSSGFTSIADASGRIWTARWDSQSELLGLVAPHFVPPTALHFRIDNAVAPASSTEAPPGVGFSFEAAGTEANAFQGRSHRLAMQAVQHVDVLGKFTSIQAQLRQLTEDQVLYTLSVSIALSCKPSIGDAVTVESPYLLSMRLSRAPDSACFGVVLNPHLSTVVIKLLCRNLPSNFTISVFLQSTDPEGRITCGDGGCALATVSTDSNSCPARAITPLDALTSVTDASLFLNISRDGSAFGEFTYSHIGGVPRMGFLELMFPYQFVWNASSYVYAFSENSNKSPLWLAEWSEISNSLHLM
jgi:hypothetical protein